MTIDEGEFYLNKEQLKKEFNELKQMDQNVNNKSSFNLNQYDINLENVQIFNDKDINDEEKSKNKLILVNIQKKPDVSIINQDIICNLKIEIENKDSIIDEINPNDQAFIEEKEEGKSTWALFPVNQWDPLEQSPDVMAAPSSTHWIGTDSLGRDVTARLLYGLRVSLSYGLMFWAMCFIIGITIGSVQGYFAGNVDFFTERVKELIEILPFLSVVILVNGLMKSDSFWITLGVVVAFSWSGVASQLRAQFLSLRKLEFCDAARAAGAGHARIIFKHILPNSLTPILTLTPFTVSGGIATLAVLDYLGFGLSPPTPSLGELLQQGRTYIQNAVWLLITPTVALSWMLISINLIGESLREAFDPRK